MLFATVIPFIKTCVVHADTVQCDIIKTLNRNTTEPQKSVSVIQGSQTDVTDGGKKTLKKERKSFSALLSYQIGTLSSNCRLKFSPHAHTSKTCTKSKFYTGDT